LPFKLGLGGRQGSGKQWMSWITLADHVAAIRHAIDADALSGPVNFTAPNPVTNSEFATTLGQALHRPTVLPTPLLPLKMRYGSELVEDMLLASQRALPKKLAASSFVFSAPSLGRAFDLMFAK
jgi:NAD dependent epimerase/dehydratase family enzyme